MKDCLVDIFIIGGGINGTAIAADAAGRGLSVTLCDKGDLAAATSSASSKLIHGGLRYLENYKFGLVKKALQEREILLANAAHIISPLEFILPYEKHMRPAWLIRLGLFLYDHLAAHPRLPSSKSIALQDHFYGEALLPIFKKGFVYYDCRVDDSRLVVLNALAAQQRSATILTHMTCIAATFEQNHWKIHLKNSAGQDSFSYAKVLVNATGPWVSNIHENLGITTPLNIELVKGSHIVVPQLYPGDFAYILQNLDGRIVFVIPYQTQFTLIGTTDIPLVGDLDKVTCSDEEATYLCNILNQYFKKTLTTKDIIWSYAGVRCLQNDGANNPSALTRDYKLELQKSPPLLTIIGGKITTHRCLAEDALSMLLPFFPSMKPPWTAQQPLPGGDFPAQDFAAFYAQVKAEYAWLPEDILCRYTKSYGTRMKLFLQDANCIADLGVAFAGGLYQKEVEYLIQQEWATSSEDILWRRTKLGLSFSASDIHQLDKWLSVYFSCY